jgi:phenylacetate-CoA ligase
MSFDIESAVVRYILHPLWAIRDHPYYGSYRRQVEAAQFLTPQELKQLQHQRLGELLEHAYFHTQFYRDRLDAAGVKPADFYAPECLRAIPVLTKLDIQQNMQAMTADNVPADRRAKNQTGGSTGMPVQFYVDLERFDSRMASTARHDAWAGYRAGDWCAYLWGARLDMISGQHLWDRLRNRFLYRRIELNTSGISAQDWKVFLAEVRRKRPRVMLAYAQSAVLFAKHVRENDIRDIHFRSIITTSEVLFPEQRRLLEETFQAEVFNRYGSREVSVVASECERHTGLHVNADALLMEIQPDPSIPAPDGKILITDLLNRSMPLIRYEIGDVGRWSETACSCGRGLPLLQDLQGRLTDFLVMPDGRQISGVALLTWVFADIRELQHVQIIQDSRDEVKLKIVPGPTYSQTVEGRLRDRLRHYLHSEVKISVELCDEVEISASGKRRFVINRLPS